MIDHEEYDKMMKALVLGLTVAIRTYSGDGV